MQPVRPTILPVIWSSPVQSISVRAKAGKRIGTEPTAFYITYPGTMRLTITRSLDEYLGSPFGEVTGGYSSVFDITTDDAYGWSLFSCILYCQMSRTRAGDCPEFQDQRISFAFHPSPDKVNADLMLFLFQTAASPPSR
jgi:hypothetical protein